MSVRSVRIIIMRAVFSICGNETQLGLQLVEKLATPLVRLGLHRRSKILYPNHFLTLDPKSIRRDASFARLDFQTVRAKGRKVASKIEEFFFPTSFKDWTLKVLEDTHLLLLVSYSQRYSFSQELTPTLTKFPFHT